jgi:hypothetical protein
MHEFFDAVSGVQGKNLTILLVFAIAGLTLAIIAGFSQWRKVEQRRTDAALKKEMLQRGMSADEIVRVIEAGQIRCVRISRHGAAPTESATFQD